MVKQRWTKAEGELAVRETVAAAAYLASQRESIYPFRPLLGCQGVDTEQYKRCVAEVLNHAQSTDVIGLGGWCILGRKKSYLPVFEETTREVIPMIAEAGCTQVHIFGVTWYKPSPGFPVPPLQRLLHECDKFGISASTDGTSPIGSALWKNIKKSGADFNYWRHNLAWVKAKLATLRESSEYQKCSKEDYISKQLRLF